MKTISCIKRFKNSIKKTGSGTLVVVISSLIFVMYVTSTYADVRHLKSMQERYEQNIITINNLSVDNMQSEYEKVL